MKLAVYNYISLVETNF